MFSIFVFTVLTSLACMGLILSAICFVSLVLQNKILSVRPTWVLGFLMYSVAAQLVFRLIYWVLFERQ